MSWHISAEVITENLVVNTLTIHCIKNILVLIPAVFVLFVQTQEDLNMPP